MRVQIQRSTGRISGQVLFGVGLALWAGLSWAAQVAPISSSSVAAISSPQAVSSVSAPPTVPAPAASSLAPAVPVLSAADLQAAETLLRERHAATVKRAVSFTPGDAVATYWQGLAQAAWTAGGHVITADQAVIVVNRNPKAQAAAVMIAHPQGAWTLIGVSPVSTGQAGRKKHFITPTGVFAHDGSIMDYRALGTKNENGIRGIGAKGSRVWDFGWQQAQAGWIKTPEVRTMRMAMHATDPDYLEQRLGHPASEGCIRIGAGLNKFIDHFGLLDQVYWEQAPTSKAIRALLPKDAQPTLAGRYLIVVDEPAREAEPATTGVGAARP
jgi:hypothetical protein